MCPLLSKLFIFAAITLGLVGCGTADQIIQPTPTAAPLVYSLNCAQTTGTIEKVSIKIPDAAAIDALIYLPACYDSEANRPINLPTLYLFHGGMGNETQWQRLGVFDSADTLIAAQTIQPAIIITPDLTPFSRSFYIEFGRHVLPYIDNNYRSIAQRKYRAVGGVSAGAYATFKVGLDRNDLFSAVGLHAAANRWEGHPIADPKPQIYIDLGESDGLIKTNTDIMETLDFYEIPYKFHTSPGGHDFPYFVSQLENYLIWYDSTWGN